MYISNSFLAAADALVWDHILRTSQQPKLNQPQSLLFKVTPFNFSKLPVFCGTHFGKLSCLAPTVITTTLLLRD